MPITATPYTKVLSVPDNRILGNNSGGTAAAIALTPAQVATMLALISDTAYNEATWNGVTDVAPSKNAVRDQFEVLSASISAAVSDTAYNEATWNAVTTIAPSKNAVRDWIQTLGDAAYTASSSYATAGHNHSGVYDPAGTAATLVASYVPLAGGTWTGPMTGTGNLVEFRSGTNAQTIRLDKTWTSSTNFEALRIDASSSGPRIGSEVGSLGGTTQDLDFGYWDSAAAWKSVLHLDVGTTNTATIASEVQSVLLLTSANTTNANGSAFRSRRSRGTIAAPAAISLNDLMANLSAFGHDGTSWSGVQAQWYAAASENWTGTNHGTFQAWWTTANGSTTALAHMRLNDDGALVIGQGTIGVTATGGALEVKSTTEQLRLWYSAANYMTTTVGSAGAVTFDANGASASFVFSDNLTPSARLILPMGEINYFSGTGTTVTIAAQSNGSTNMVKAAPATAVSGMEHGFDNGGANNGRLRYTGATTRMMHVALTWTAAPATSNDQFVLGIAKNGTVVASSKVLQKFGASTDYQASAMHVMVEMAMNDYLELYVGNMTAGRNCTVYSLNLFAAGF